MGHEQMLKYCIVLLLIWVHSATRSLLEVVELVIYGLVHEIEEDGEANLVVASSAPRFVVTARPSTSF